MASTSGRPYGHLFTELAVRIDGANEASIVSWLDSWAKKSNLETRSGLNPQGRGRAHVAAGLAGVEWLVGVWIGELRADRHLVQVRWEVKRRDAGDYATRMIDAMVAHWDAQAMPTPRGIASESRPGGGDALGVAPPPQELPPTLTENRRRIAELWRGGKTQGEIAEQVGLAAKTVENIIPALRNELGSGVIRYRRTAPPGK